MSEPFFALFTHAMVYSDEIEDKIDQVMPELKRRYPGLTNYRWHALKLLEEDKEITEKYPVNLPQVLDRSYESDIINQKYDFIGEIIGEVLLHKERQDLLTERADKLLTSKVWSIANKGKCFCLAHYEVTIAKDTVNSQ